MNKFYIISNSIKDPQRAALNEISNYIIHHKGFVLDTPKDCECIIVLGGDGTLLKAARDLNHSELPLLGINIGTLGFLTDADMDTYKLAIDSVINNDYIVDKRMMIKGKIYRENQLIYENMALNDVVINRCGNLRVIDFDICVNGQFLSSYLADGVIIATATGSTAYSLSAGGPILQPNAKLIMVTPICPHTLNKRSIIFDCNDVVSIKITDNKKLSEERIVTFDGEQFFNVRTDDIIEITKSRRMSRFIKTNKDSFLKRVREKLM
ncbi:MAG: NAD(+)/NADH kinase [Lachnospira sp.]|nr:NAD(+)/NADH kinase [Lachnospira sp.]